MPQKVTFRLSKEDRLDMMNKIMNNARERLLEHKLNGINFQDIAEDIKVPKPRISEIYNRRYLSENTLVLLMRHGYMNLSDIANGLNENQLSVLNELANNSHANELV